MSELTTSQVCNWRQSIRSSYLQNKIPRNIIYFLQNINIGTRQPEGSPVSRARPDQLAVSQLQSVPTTRTVWLGKASWTRPLPKDNWVIKIMSSLYKLDMLVRVTYKLPAVRCPMAFVHLPHVHGCEEKNQCNKTEKAQDILLRVLLANSELFRDWMWYQNQVTSTEKRTIWVNRIIPMERRNQKAARSWKHHKQPALVMIPTTGAS